MDKPEPNWKWWVGFSDERYSEGPFETREEAIEVGRDYYPDGFYLTRAVEWGDRGKMQLSELIDMKEIIRDMDSRGDWEEIADPDGDPFIDCSDAQLEDLAKMVKETIDMWQAQHKIVIKAGLFKHCEPPEYIVESES